MYNKSIDGLSVRLQLNTDYYSNPILIPRPHQYSQLDFQWILNYSAEYSIITDTKTGKTFAYLFLGITFEVKT